MKDFFGALPLYECTRDLADTAMGRKPADTVIKNARLVNVCTREVQENVDIAITSGRIALVGDASHCIGEGTEIIDAGGAYASPGFMDGHMHVESSMLSVGEYAKVVLPHGTTGIFMDPHEMCNVSGLEGVRCMMKDAKRAHLKTFMTTPSCVPAVKGFEDSGAEINADDVRETMNWDCTVGLGEMMNFPGILSSDENVHNIVAETLKAKKTVTGHYSIPETGKGLNAYIASGARCCHESTRPEDVTAKMRLGMYAQIREGSAWHDLKVLAPSIVNKEIDTRFACLVSDDSHPRSLMVKGHLDHIIRVALEAGIDALTAIQMVTINTAQCFGMDGDLGSISPGKCADLILIGSLEKIDVKMTMINGQVVAKDGELTVEFEPYSYPDWIRHSINIQGPITEESFRIPYGGSEAKVRMIEIIPHRTSTKAFEGILKTVDGGIAADPGNDILKAAVFERHNRTGNKGFGFVKGFGIRKGAIAQTVAHDAHNLIVLGANDRDMAVAANALIECGGGYTAVLDGKVLETVDLPVAGIMNDTSLQYVHDHIKNLKQAWVSLGCNIHSPFMTMSILCLSVLPELRLTDRGYVDVTKFCMTDLIIE